MICFKLSLVTWPSLFWLNYLSTWKLTWSCNLWFTFVKHISITTTCTRVHACKGAQIGTTWHSVASDLFYVTSPGKSKRSREVFFTTPDVLDLKSQLLLGSGFYWRNFYQALKLSPYICLRVKRYLLHL